MQDLITASIFAVTLATTPHPWLFVCCVAVLLVTLGFRQFIIFHLPHRRGNGRRYL